MTIQTTTNTISYTASGSQQVFAYNYIVLDATHMQVYEDGVLTTEAYTVDGIGNPAGGNVNFTTYTPASGVIITLLRVVPLTQLVDYKPYDPFPAETHEAALDKLTQITQQLQEELTRSFKFAPGSPESGITWESLIGNAGRAYVVTPTEDGFIAGPNADEIANAQTYANHAAASAAAAESSATAAASSASSAASSAALASNFAKNNLLSNSRLTVWSKGVLSPLGNILSSDDMSADNTADWAGDIVSLVFSTDHYVLTASTSNQFTYKNVAFTAQGERLVRVSFDIKNGTASSTELVLRFYNGTTWQDGLTKYATQVGWTTVTDVFTVPATSTACWAGIKITSNLSNLNMQLKNFAVQDIVPAIVASNNAGPDTWGRFHNTLQLFRNNDLTIPGEQYAIAAIKGATTVESMYWPRGNTDYTTPSWYRKFRGQSVVFGAWVSTVHTNHVRLVINDGVTAAYSPYHTGGGSYEWLEVTSLVSASSTTLLIQIDFAGASGRSADISAPMFSYGAGFGSSRFQPKSEDTFWLDEPKIFKDFNGVTISADISIDVAAQISGIIPPGAKAIYVNMISVSGVINQILYLSNGIAYGVSSYSKVSGISSVSGWVPYSNVSKIYLGRTGTHTSVTITVHGVKFR